MLNAAVLLMQIDELEAEVAAVHMDLKKQVAEAKREAQDAMYKWVGLLVLKTQSCMYVCPACKREEDGTACHLRACITVCTRVGCSLTAFYVGILCDPPGGHTMPCTLLKNWAAQQSRLLLKGWAGFGRRALGRRVCGCGAEE